jgi:hypothetical protein
MTTPDNWVDEDRPEFVEQIVDGMVSQMTIEEMRQAVWDNLYDELIFQEWSELWAHAQEYAPELLDRFRIAGQPSF